MDAIDVLRLEPGMPLEPLGRWLAHPGIARGLNIRPITLTPAQLAAYVAGFDGRTGVLLGVFHATALVGVATFDVNPRHATASLTLVIGERRWRRFDGVLLIAMNVLAWAFEDAALEKVSARVAADKAVLLRLLATMGVRREGRLRQEVRTADGRRRRDEIVFGLLREEWPPMRDAIVARLTQDTSKSNPDARTC